MAKIIITGANGFVGQALWSKLAAVGHEIHGIARRALNDGQFNTGSYHRIDLSQSAKPLIEIFNGAEVVFHVASKVDLWGDYEDFFQANVIATQNVITACRAAQVRYLIYTSSPSVVSDGSDLLGVNEDFPYPKKHLAFYPQTKAIAERYVREAASESLKTISLRPHLIWGPGDTHLIPTIVERARQSKLVQIGNGENLVDNTHIDSCVAAHICAWQALKDRAELSGRVYFISEGRPIKMWSWIKQILEQHQIDLKLKKLPTWFAYCIALLAEAYSKLRSSKELPLLTRFTVDQLSTSHYFDISRAKQELGYQPLHAE